MDEENKVIIYIAVILLGSFLFVGLLFLAAGEEANLREFCEREGGVIEVIDRYFDVATKTTQNVYGCVK